MNLSDWHWPQFVYIALLAIRLIRVIGKFDEPRPASKYDAGDLLGCGLIVWLLYEGGFWGPHP